MRMATRRRPVAHPRTITLAALFLLGVASIQVPVVYCGGPGSGREAAPGAVPAGRARRRAASREPYRSTPDGIPGADGGASGHQTNGPRLALSLAPAAPAALAGAAVPCRPGTERSLGVRPDLLSGQGPFTLAAWIRLDGRPVSHAGGTTPYRTILSRQSDGLDDSFLFGVRIGNRREAAFIFHLDEGRMVRVLGGTVALQTWHHLAVTRQTAGFRLYLDGVLVREQACDDALPAAATPLLLGANRNPRGLEHHLHGQVADLTVWHGALDPEAIAALHSGQEVGSTEGAMEAR